jgi:VCBS repeat-containing protein
MITVLGVPTGLPTVDFTIPTPGTNGANYTGEIFVKATTNSVVSVLDGVEVLLLRQTAAPSFFNPLGTWQQVAGGGSQGLFDLVGLFGQQAYINVDNLPLGTYKAVLLVGDLQLGGPDLLTLSVDWESHTKNPTYTATPEQGNVLTNDSAGLHVTTVNGQNIAPVGNTTITTGYGTLVINANGDYTYTASTSGAGYGKIDVLTYTVDNGHGSTDTATLYMAIGPSTLPDSTLASALSPSLAALDDHSVVVTDTVHDNKAVISAITDHKGEGTGAADGHTGAIDNVANDLSGAVANVTNDHTGSEPKEPNGKGTETETLNGTTDHAGAAAANDASSHIGGTDSGDTTHSLSGTLAMPLADGEMVHVFRDGVDIGSASADSSNWTFTDNNAAAGVHTYSVAVVDSTGNQGTMSDTWMIGDAHGSVLGATEDHETVVGTGSNEILSDGGHTGVSLVGDNGDDQFLVSGSGTTVSGGAGFNTLLVTGAGLSLNLDNVTGVEKVALGTNGDNTLSVSLKDVLQIQDAETSKTLMVTGDASDTVQLKTVDGFAHADGDTQVINGAVFDVYHATSGHDLATLLLQQNMHVQQAA